MTIAARALTRMHSLLTQDPMHELRTRSSRRRDFQNAVSRSTRHTSRCLHAVRLRPARTASRRAPAPSVSSSDHSSTLAFRPRTSASPTAIRSSTGRTSICLVVSAMNSWSGVPLVMPSRRAAVLVVSPSAVYSRRRSEPDVARHHRPAVEADAHLEAVVQALVAQPAVEALHPREHLAGGLERPVGVVGLLQRRAEHGHDAVAHVGHERAAVVEDRLAHLGQVLVQRLDHALRLERLGEAREPAQVAEHDGRLAAHAAEPHAVGVGQHLVDHRLGHEARERVARLLALERDREAVDGAGGQEPPRARRRTDRSP